ncbi:MAG: class I SAM-dependent methyltransferase [Catenulispora sp.]
MSVEESYNEAAEQYAALFSGTLSKYPLERGVLASFGELAAAVGGPVADLGCGPGHITAYLAAQGLDAFGVDLSPEMIRIARATNPGLRFEVGSMVALDDLGVADETLSGILSRYSIIHTPPAEVPAVLAEFRRVLAPGGYVLVSFPGTADASPPVVSYDHTVVTAYRWWPDHFSALLGAAGLEELGRVIERPAPDAPRPFPMVTLLARRSN